MGKRLFGDNKTIGGTSAGIVGGIVIGYLESAVFNLPYLFLIAIALSVGAMFGDILGSFIKRRLDYKASKPFPIMDQYGFFVFALLFAFSLGNLPNIYGLVFLVILTGIMHPLTNIIAYVLRIKKVPW